MRLGTRRRTARLLFATDLHGSELVYRKFLNAVSIYEATIAVLGGDLTGKGLVPIVKTNGNHKVTISGTPQLLTTPRELDQAQRTIRDLGQYPLIVTTDEHAQLANDPKARDQAFERVCQDQVADWMARAADRLKPLGVPLYVTGGNDDFHSIEPILDNATYITNADGKVLEVAEHTQMLSSGNANPTPWHCPRDITEEQLAVLIDELASQLTPGATTIFNLHVPPYGSGLDVCPKLDTSVDPPRPLVGEETNAGSTAVRDAITRYAPAVSLHGHIHEAAGIQHLGPTTAINPGSEYGEGVLRSAVIDLDDRGRVAAQLLSA